MDGRLRELFGKPPDTSPKPTDAPPDKSPDVAGLPPEAEIPMMGAKEVRTPILVKYPDYRWELDISDGAMFIRSETRPNLWRRFWLWFFIGWRYRPLAGVSLPGDTPK